MWIHTNSTGYGNHFVIWQDDELAWYFLRKKREILCIITKPQQFRLYQPEGPFAMLTWSPVHAPTDEEMKMEYEDDNKTMEAWTSLQRDPISFITRMRL